MKNDSATLVTTLVREIKKYDANDLGQLQGVFRGIKEESQGNIVYISITDSSMNMVVSDEFIPDSGKFEGNLTVNSGTDAVSSASIDSHDTNTSIAIAEGKILGSELETKTGEKVYNVSAPIIFGSDLSGTLNIGVSLKSMYDQLTLTLFEILVLSLIIQAIAVILGVLIVRSLTRPITDILHKLDAFEKGDFSIEFNTKSKGEMQKLTNALNSAVSFLRDAIGTVKNTASDLYNAAKYLSDSSNESAVSSEEISRNIQDVTGDIEKQSATISNIVSALNEFGNKLNGMKSLIDSLVENNSRIKDSANLGYDRLQNLINYGSVK